MREPSTGKPQTPRPGRVRGAAFVTALLFACGVFAGPTATPGQSGQALTLSASDYEARVYAAWIGQIIGHIYGLSYEFRFIDDAGPRPTLSIPHLLSGEASAYYHGYVLAQMAVYQTRDHFLRKYGSLLDEPGIGHVTAATFVLSWSHRGRCRNEAAFAQLAGAAPVPATSGQTQNRHRLNRRGDWRVNDAPYIVATTRLRQDPQLAPTWHPDPPRARPNEKSCAA